MTRNRAYEKMEIGHLSALYDYKCAIEIFNSEWKLSVFSVFSTLIQQREKPDDRTWWDSDPVWTAADDWQNA